MAQCGCIYFIVKAQGRELSEEATLIRDGPLFPFFSSWRAYSYTMKLSNIMDRNSILLDKLCRSAKTKSG